MVDHRMNRRSPLGSPLRRSLRGLRLRTEMTLRDIPVFRSAYSASRNARAPAASRPSVGGGASLSPFSAPNQLFELLRCSAWLIHDFAPSPMRALVFRSAYSASRNARASAAFAASIKAHCAVSSETLMLQVRCANPPMPHRTSFSSCSGVPVGLFGKPKRSTSRFASLTLRNSSVGVGRAAALLTRMGARGE